jgi:bifunctional UDP-N-acetylglucosamine pyrophosphorylase/glucosamine-1-phosphate N-acetyltransferase
LADCRVRQGAEIGPFARLRPGADIGEKSVIGNFVEVKNTCIGRHTKAKHLAVLSDADIGDQVNIGAGTITCNYDGFTKHETIIGDNAFVGSNSSLIAPVRIGRGAIVGAGSTVTNDVEDNALTLTRSNQTDRPQGAIRYRQKNIN